MEYDAKYPIILRKISKFMELLVKHNKLAFRKGVRETLNQIRTNRSSHQRCSIKIGVLKNFAKFTLKKKKDSGTGVFL